MAFLIWFLVAFYAAGRHARFWPDALTISLLGGLGATILGALQRLATPLPPLAYLIGFAVGTLYAFFFFNVALWAGRLFRRYRRNR